MSYVSPYAAVKNEDAVMLATNENPYGFEADEREALSELLSRANRYPKVDNEPLRRKISEMHGMGPENVALGAGSDEILALATISLVGAGDNTVMANPSFFRYKQLTELAGGDCRLVPCKAFAHDLDAMLAAVDGATRVVFLCNPNNPTGTVLDDESIREFADALPSNVVLVVDEAYFEYIWPQTLQSATMLIDRRANVLVLRSFSKFYALAGLRIGYALGRSDVIQRLNNVRSPYSVTDIAQQAAMLVLDDKNRSVRLCEENNREKSRYYRFFNEIGIEYIESHANFIFADFGVDSERWVAHLCESQVVIRPCDIFGFPNHVRITVGTPGENGMVIQKLKEVACAS